MNNIGYTTNVGDYIVMQVAGDIRDYIAEVVQSDPLTVKIEEHGPYEKIKGDDCIIDEIGTESVQKDDAVNTCMYLLWRDKNGWRPLISGLKSLGVPNDGKLHEILPAV